jgi:hypothetical protein
MNMVYVTSSPPPVPTRNSSVTQFWPSPRSGRRGRSAPVVRVAGWTGPSAARSRRTPPAGWRGIGAAHGRRRAGVPAGDRDLAEPRPKVTRRSSLRSLTCCGGLLVDLQAAKHRLHAGGVQRSPPRAVGTPSPVSTRAISDNDVPAANSRAMRRRTCSSVSMGRPSRVPLRRAASSASLLR